MNLPKSFRSREGELAYQKAREAGTLLPLSKEPHIKEFKYWFMVENRFPGDKAFSVHHLLLPLSEVSDWEDLLDREKQEYYTIRQYYLAQEYDLVYENMPKLRSIANHFHFHCVCLKEQS